MDLVAGAAGDGVGTDRPATAAPSSDHDDHFAGGNGDDRERGHSHDHATYHLDLDSGPNDIDGGSGQSPNHHNHCGYGNDSAETGHDHVRSEAHDDDAAFSQAGTGAGHGCAGGCDARSIRRDGAELRRQSEWQFHNSVCTGL